MTSSVRADRSPCAPGPSHHYYHYHAQIISDDPLTYQHLVPPAIAFHFLLQEPFRRLDRGSIIFQCYPYISFWYFSECRSIIFQCYLYISFWYFSECAWAHTIAFSQHITYFSFGGATESKEYKLPQQLASFYTPL